MTIVVQLERIGDVVQSIPAIRVVARGGSGALLLVREGIGEWARLLAPSSVRVVELETARVDDVRRALAAGPRCGRVAEAAREACAAAGFGPGGNVVSLSWDATGAAVAAVLAESGGAVTGPARGADGRTACHGVWALYPLAAVDAKPWGCVHMTDVRRLLAEEATGDLADPAELHAEPAGDGERDLALIVPGASDPARVWPARCFAELARGLAAEGLAPVVIGGGGDVARADAIVESSGGSARSMAGRLAPSGLRAFVERAAVVVGGDTGPVHFASWLGAPTVMLMSGRAHAWETGPVSPGDLALQALPVGASPIGRICPEIVFGAARSLFRGTEPPASGPNVRVLRARRAPDADALGGVMYDDADALGGVMYDDADALRTARALLGRLAAVAGRTAFSSRPTGGPGPSHAGFADAARLAGRAAERAAAALDASARCQPGRAARALTDAVRLAEDVAIRLEAEDSLRVVAALVRLLAGEAAHPDASVCGSRLARLFADLEAGLGVGAPSTDAAMTGTPA